MKSMGMRIPDKIKKPLKYFWCKTVMLDYPYQAVIRNYRNGAIVVETDYIKVCENGDYQRLYTGEKFKNIDFGSLGVRQGGGSFVELWHPERGIYKPIKMVFDQNEPKLLIGQTEYVNWAREKVKELRLLKYQSKNTMLGKFIPILLIIITGMMMAMILYFASDNWKQVAPIANAMGGLAKALQNATTAGTLIPRGGT